jgi:di/tricarboxylate transporter
MNTQLALVLTLLIAAIAMFAINKPRMDAVALLMMTALPFTGVITIKEALAGFSDPNIVLIAVLFVLGEGLVRTGVAQGMGDLIMSRAGGGETRLLVILMFAVALIGSVVSSTGVVAIFIPVALRIAKQSGISPSRLMMPLSVAALVSGMLTLVGTAPNLVVNSELVRHGENGFHFFSFTPFGLPLLVVAILYMIFARRLLPAANGSASEDTDKPSLRGWVNRYKLAGREHRVRITDQSPLVDKTLEELDLRDRSGVNLVAIERERGRSRNLIQPTAKTELRAGDILLVDVSEAVADIEALTRQLRLEAMPLTGDYFMDRSQEIGMVEVVLSPDSDLVGKTVREAKVRTRYGLTLIGLRRGPRTLESGCFAEVLKAGDTLLLIGPWNGIAQIQSDRRDLVVLNFPAERDELLKAPGKRPQALACLALVVVLMVTGLVPNVQAVLIGCLLMGALGCIDLDSAYRSIHWKSLVLIVGMLPFSIALEKTGGVALAADLMTRITAGAGIHVMLACLFVITALLGLFVSNTATAILMAPVALAIADGLGASPYPFAMIVALASSAAFMTPISSPVNTLVVGPGSYSFGDFVRVGVPLTVIVMIICVFLVAWLLPPR